MDNKFNVIQIMKTLEKLFIAGFNTEKRILTMQMEDLIKINNLTSNETLIIIDFKKAVKDKQIISFLSGYKERKDENGISKEKSTN